MGISCSSGAADKKLKYGGCLKCSERRPFVVADQSSLSVCCHWWLPVSWYTPSPLIRDQSDIIFISSVKPTFFYVHIKLYFFNFIWMHHHNDDDDDDVVGVVVVVDEDDDGSLPAFLIRNINLWLFFWNKSCFLCLSCVPTVFHCKILHLTG